jgi:hypothetical protein
MMILKMQTNNREQENIIKSYWNVMTMQSLYEYFVGFWLSSRDWLGIIYASFGVIGIEWVL